MEDRLTETIRKLDRLRDLAKRVLQAPPVLYDDPSIDKDYEYIKNYLERGYQNGKDKI